MTSLRAKLVRLLLLVSALIAVPTLLIVTSSDMRQSEANLESTERYIRDGILRKGQVLANNHALVLQGLTLDNAFTGMQELVARAVSDDGDLLYGVYVSTQGETLAYATSDRKPNGRLPSEPFRELGLSRESFGVAAFVARDARVGGRDVLEVAAPVWDEDPKAPPLGTIRYGLSTRQVDDAIALATARASTELRRSVVFLIALVGVATLIGLSISQAQATRIAHPVQELAAAASALARGERNVRVNIHSRDELQALGQAFNQMVVELDASYRDLESLNHSLEERIERRTLELSEANRELCAVLDNVDQGLVMLCPLGGMSGHASASVRVWFGEYHTGMLLSEYLASVSIDFSTSFELAWEQLADGFLPLELCITQLPKQLDANGRSWSFRYIPLMQGQELQGVLVVVADVTELLAQQAETQLQRELMQTFKRFVQDRTGLQAFIRETSASIRSLRSTSADSAQTARTLHTLKGNAALMDLNVISSLCHELETEHAEGPLRAQTLTRLEHRWEQLLRHVQELTGTERDTLDIDRAEHAAAVERLSQNPSDPTVQRLIRSWAMRSVETDFELLTQQAVSLAQRLGKGPITVRRASGGIRLDQARFGRVMAELVHAVRNAVDHGLEPSAERTAAGKPAYGHLGLRARLDSDALILELADDGRGLDHIALRERARTLGLPYSTDEEVVALICRAGVSTRVTADAISGRGVGMAALEHAVRRLGGSLTVRSAPGVGTTWLLVFPGASGSGSVYSPTLDGEQITTSKMGRSNSMRALGGV